MLRTCLTLLIAGGTLSAWAMAGEDKNSTNADAALREASRYSNHATEALDQERAIRILQQFLKVNENKLSPVDEVKVCLELGTLYSYRVPLHLRDRNLSLHWRRRAVAAAPDKISFELSIARSNLVTSLANGSQKTKETAKEIRWRKSLLLLDNLRGAVLWEGNPSEEKKGAIARGLAKGLRQDSTMHESVVRDAASRGAYDELRILMREFKPGARAYLELARAHIPALVTPHREGGKGGDACRVFDIGKAEDPLGAVLAKTKEMAQGKAGVTRARFLLEEYLELKADELAAPHRQRALLQLARMYGLLAPDGEKDNLRAGELYREVLSMSDVLSRQAIAARVEIPLVLAEPSDEVDEAIRQHLWITTKLDAPVLLIEKLVAPGEGAIPYTGHELSARVFEIRETLREAENRLCNCMISVARSSHDPSALLSKIAENYLAGALACQTIIEQGVSGWDGVVELPLMLRSRVGFLKHFRRRRYDARVVTGFLGNLERREVAGVENGLEVLLCDMVLAALEEYVYGIREYEESLYVMSREERDQLIREWPDRWKKDRAGYVPDSPLAEGTAPEARMKIRMVQAAIRRLREVTKVERYCSVLRKFLCTDFAYQLRVGHLEEEPDTVLDEIEDAWRQVMKLAPENWGEALIEHATASRRLEQEHWDVVAREIARKRVELIRNPISTGTLFLDTAWPKWKQSNAGKRQAWLWLRGSRTRFGGSPASDKLQELYERLDREMYLGDLVDKDTPIYLQILRK